MFWFKVIAVFLLSSIVEFSKWVVHIHVNAYNKNFEYETFPIFSFWFVNSLIVLSLSMIKNPIFDDLALNIFILVMFALFSTCLIFIFCYIIGITYFVIANKVMPYMIKHFRNSIKIVKEIEQ